MGRLVIEIKRIEPEYEGRTIAQIVAFRKGKGIGFEVVSKNSLFKKHLNQVLAAGYHAVMPGPQGGPYFPNHAEFFYPGTISFLTFLHDRLGWYGYISDVFNKNEVIKSIFQGEDEFDEDNIFDSALTKAVNWAAYTRTNKEGHTILIQVPPGYVAVSKNGRVVGPGKRIGRQGVDLDKPDATWSLQIGEQGETQDLGQDEWRMVPNKEWEAAYTQNPKAARKEALQAQMKKLAGLPGQKYHPGMHKEIYEEPGLFEGKAYAEDIRRYFDEGISLEQILSNQIAGDINDKELGGSDVLPENVLLLSQDKSLDMQILTPANQFGKVKDKASDWVMFDASDYMNLSKEQLAQMRVEAKNSGERLHPALIPGVFDKIKAVPNGYVQKKLDTSAALPHSLKDLYMDRIVSMYAQEDEPDKPVTEQDEKETADFIAQIFKDSQAALQAREGKLKRTKQVKAALTALQKYDKQLEDEYFYRDDNGVLKPKSTKERLTSIKGLTNGKGKEDVYFDFLPKTGDPVGLMTHQIYGVRALTHHQRYSAFGGPEENDGMFLNWKQGIGKALRLDEKILTPTGWVKNKDLNIGDFVVGSNGQPTKIVGIYPQGKRKLYRITFSDGSYIDADGEHQWAVLDFKQRRTLSNRKQKALQKQERAQLAESEPINRVTGRKRRGNYKNKEIEPVKYQVKRTKDMLSSVYTDVHGYRSVNYSIPWITSPVEYETTEDLPMDAYTLGALLGDAHFGTSCTIVSQDVGIIDNLSGEIKHILSRNNAVNIYRVNHINPVLKSLGLKGTKAKSKFIPKKYLYASIDDRVSLLQGLMDTDGSVQTSRHNPVAGAEFTTISEQLAYDVQELVWSLGGKITISTKIGSYINSEGVKVRTNKVYRLYIQFVEGTSFNPFRLERKANAFMYSGTGRWHRYITNIEPISEEEAQCLAVDAPDHLFITKDFIVTHNTYTVLAADAVMRNKGLFKGTHIITAPRAVVTNWDQDLQFFRKKKKNEDYFVIEGTPSQREQLWDEIDKRTKAGKPPQFVIIGSGKMMFNKIEQPEDNIGEEEQYAPGADEGDKREELEFANDLRRMRETLIEPGHVSAISVDETGLFTNPDSKRHMALKALINLATSRTNTDGKEKPNKAVIWTLSGNIMGNSATDAISEFGWVNAGVRLHADEIKNRFTTKVHKNTERRVFNREDGKKPGLATFMRSFQHAINRMNYVKAVGKQNKHNNEVKAPVGKEYAKVYRTAMDKLERMYDPNLGPEFRRFKLGMITMLMGASQNVIKPQRLIEYGLDGDSGLMASMKQLLPPAEYKEFVTQVEQYRREVSNYTEENDIGWLPMARTEDEEGGTTGYTIGERNDLYDKTIAEPYRELLHNITSSGRVPVKYKGKKINGWSNPIASFIQNQVSTAVHNGSLLDRVRLGFSSQSRMLAEAVHHALGSTAGLSRQLLTGGTKQSEIAAMQDKHAEKEGAPIMTFTTGAATYGVNFNSNVAFVTESWNPAKKEQGVSRFHRDITKPITIYSLSSTGIGNIVRDIARQKAAWANAAEGIDFSDDEAVQKVLEQVMGTELSSDNFLTKLKNNPIVVEED